MNRDQNVSARVAESVSVLCPVCGERVSFRPIVAGVQILNAHDHVTPRLHVALQPGNVIPHSCPARPVPSTRESNHE